MLIGVVCIVVCSEVIVVVSKLCEIFAVVVCLVPVLKIVYLKYFYLSSLFGLNHKKIKMKVIR